MLLCCSDVVLLFPLLEGGKRRVTNTIQEVSYLLKHPGSSESSSAHRASLRGCISRRRWRESDSSGELPTSCAWKPRAKAIGSGPPRYLSLNWPWFCKDPFMYTPIKAFNTAHRFTKSALDEIFPFYFWWGGCLDSLLSG